MKLALLFFLLISQEDRKTSEEFVRVDVTCTAVAGVSLYLDLGREDGIQVDDRVRIFAREGPVRRGKIVSVSRTSSRAILNGGVEAIEVGMRGEVLVPQARLDELAAQRAEPAQDAEEGEEFWVPDMPPPPKPRVEHPPWTQPPEEWNESLPLLAPVHGSAPEERARRFRGRVATSFDRTTDSGGGVEREFRSGELRFDGRFENPFRKGGELGFDAEAFARSSESGGQTDSDSRLRVDRLSYARGGSREDPARIEIGRFLQRELPEFGFLDGVELSRPLGKHSTLGTSFGFRPEPDDFFRSGNDLQAAVFGRYISDEERHLALGWGFQKTWHELEADRDLIAAQLELHPARSTSLNLTALVDFYTSGDKLKDSGPELTQLFLNATHSTPGGHGFGLFASRFRFPELLSNEFDSVTAQDIADSVSDRMGVDGWLALGRSTRLYGRLEHWADEDASGSGGRARITWRDTFGPGGPLLCEVYSNNSKFSDTLGLRATARKRIPNGSLSLDWDSTNFDQNSVDETLLQHTLRASVDFGLGESWFLSFYVEDRFGDEQDALSLGFTLQRTFY